MPNVRIDGIRIEYEVFGDRSSRPLLLIMGVGAQMIDWDEELCRQLAARGFYVIRFDNRDVGLSSKIEDAGSPDVNAALAKAMRGEPIEAPYTLEDMAGDAIGLLEALHIDRAFVCGASMGGMIAQTMAVRHPSRVCGLISIMSTTGNPELAPAEPDSAEVIFTPAPEEREAYIEHTLEAWRIIGSPGFPFDEERIREKAARAYDRGCHPAGIARQFLAVMAGGNRKPALASVAAPTLVIHGSDDPLVPVSGGKDTAEAVPGAELLIIEGMGHDLPPETWPRIVEAITALADRAGP